MNFYIKKDSLLPALRMKLISDGRNDFSNFHELIQNAAITFSMVNTLNGVFKIANKEGSIVRVDKLLDNEPEYYIQYNWTAADVNTPGLYKGEFKINFLENDCPTIIVPIREELFIQVIDSFIKTSLIESL